MSKLMEKFQPQMFESKSRIESNQQLQADFKYDEYSICFQQLQHDLISRKDNEQEYLLFNEIAKNYQYELNSMCFLRHIIEYLTKSEYFQELYCKHALIYFLAKIMNVMLDLIQQYINNKEPIVGDGDQNFHQFTNSQAYTQIQRIIDNQLKYSQQICLLEYQTALEEIINDKSMQKDLNDIEKVITPSNKNQTFDDIKPFMRKINWQNFEIFRKYWNKNKQVTDFLHILVYLSIVHTINQIFFPDEVKANLQTIFKKNNLKKHQDLFFCINNTIQKDLTTEELKETILTIWKRLFPNQKIELQ